MRPPKPGTPPPKTSQTAQSEKEKSKQSAPSKSDVPVSKAKPSDTPQSEDANSSAPSTSSRSSESQGEKPKVSTPPPKIDSSPSSGAQSKSFTESDTSAKAEDNLTSDGGSKPVVHPESGTSSTTPFEGEQRQGIIPSTEAGEKPGFDEENAKSSGFSTEHETSGKTSPPKSDSQTLHPSGTVESQETHTSQKSSENTTSLEGSKVPYTYQTSNVVSSSVNQSTEAERVSIATLASTAVSSTPKTSSEPYEVASKGDSQKVENNSESNSSVAIEEGKQISLSSDEIKHSENNSSKKDVNENSSGASAFATSKESASGSATSVKEDEKTAASSTENSKPPLGYSSLETETLAAETPASSPAGSATSTFEVTQVRSETVPISPSSSHTRAQNVPTGTASIVTSSVPSSSVSSKAESVPTALTRGEGIISASETSTNASANQSSGQDASKTDVNILESGALSAHESEEMSDKNASKPVLTESSRGSTSHQTPGNDSTTVSSKVVNETAAVSTQHQHKSSSSISSVSSKVVGGTAAEAVQHQQNSISISSVASTSTASTSSAHTNTRVARLSSIFSKKTSNTNEVNPALYRKKRKSVKSRASQSGVQTAKISSSVSTASHSGTDKQVISSQQTVGDSSGTGVSVASSTTVSSHPSDVSGSSLLSTTQITEKAVPPEKPFLAYRDAESNSNIEENHLVSHENSAVTTTAQVSASAASTVSSPGTQAETSETRQTSKAATSTGASDTSLLRSRNTKQIQSSGDTAQTSIHSIDPSRTKLGAISDEPGKRSRFSMREGKALLNSSEPLGLSISGLKTKEYENHTRSDEGGPVTPPLDEDESGARGKENPMFASVSNRNKSQSEREQRYFVLQPTASSRHHSAKSDYRTDAERNRKWVSYAPAGTTVERESAIDDIQGLGSSANEERQEGDTISNDLNETSKESKVASSNKAKKDLQIRQFLKTFASRKQRTQNIEKAKESRIPREPLDSSNRNGDYQETNPVHRSRMRRHAPAPADSSEFKSGVSETAHAEASSTHGVRDLGYSSTDTNVRSGRSRMKTPSPERTKLHVPLSKIKTPPHGQSYSSIYMKAALAAAREAKNTALPGRSVKNHNDGFRHGDSTMKSFRTYAPNSHGSADGRVLCSTTPSGIVDEKHMERHIRRHRRRHGSKKKHRRHRHRNPGLGPDTPGSRHSRSRSPTRHEWVSTFFTDADEENYLQSEHTHKRSASAHGRSRKKQNTFTDTPNYMQEQSPPPMIAMTSTARPYASRNLTRLYQHIQDQDVSERSRSTWNEDHTTEHKQREFSALSHDFKRQLDRIRQKLYTAM